MLAQDDDLPPVVKVGPGGICIFFCRNSLCFIPQIQPIMLGLCPPMPNYAEYFPKDPQVQCRNKLKKPQVPR